MWALPTINSERYAWVEPTNDAVNYIAENLRESDRREVEATIGSTQYAAAMRVSVKMSASAIVAVSVFGEPLAVFGVTTTSVMHNIGSPWFLATARVRRHRRALIEDPYAYTEAMLDHYAKLENHVDARNTTGVEWLKRLGFTINPPTPYGAKQQPFHKFWKVRAPCALIQ